MSLANNEALQRIEAKLDSSADARSRWNSADPIREAILAELDKLATGPIARTALLMYEAIRVGC